MKKLIVTGAENSGTGMVKDLLTAVGCEVTHRAVPHVTTGFTDWHPLYDWLDEPVPFDAIIFVARHHPAQDASQRSRSGRESTVWDAMSHVSEMSVRLRLPLYVWTYEAIVHEWPRGFLAACKSLGLDQVALLPAPPRDENAKHYG